jgi:hypothetical protein
MPKTRGPITVTLGGIRFSATAVDPDDAAFERSPVMALDGIAGIMETPKQIEIPMTIVVTDETDLDAIEAMTSEEMSIDWGNGRRVAYSGCFTNLGAQSGADSTRELTVFAEQKTRS